MPGTVPPAAKKGSKPGCWIAGVAGCGVLCILFILGIIYSATQLASNSEMKKMISTIGSSSNCSASLKQVRTALRAYRSDHNGKYPNTLEELRPNYYSSNEFVCRNDSEVHPMTYEKPKADSEPNTQVVTIYTGQMSIIKKQSQDIYYCLLKDDSIVMQQMATTIIVAPNSETIEN